MKSILILINTLNGGGAERALITLLNNLHQDEYDITLAVIYKRGKYIKSIPKHINTIFIYNSTDDKHNLIKDHPEVIYNKYLKNNWDIEISFLEGNATKIISKSDNKTSIKIAYIHIDLFYEHYTEHLYNSIEDEKNDYGMFDRIAFVSTAAMNGFEKLFGTMYHNKSFVVYNPIDKNNILEQANIEIIHNEQTTICAIGRLTKQKRFDRILIATKLLVSEGYCFKIQILGQGIEKVELEKLVIELDLSNYVDFLGFIDNPYPYIKCSDLFLCSSRTEGLSLVVAEALLLGKPIISTKCSGPTEVLEKGKWGKLVDNSTIGIYRGIKEFLNNESNICTLQNINDENYNYFFGIDNYIERFNKLISKSNDVQITNSYPLFINIIFLFLNSTKY